MTPVVNSPALSGKAGGKQSRFFGPECLHAAWRVSLVITLVTGLFHLINLVGTGRAGFGPALITFFRFSFMVSWLLLLCLWAVERRLPSIDRTDALVALVALAFLARSALTPETFFITFNWVITGAGIFYLVRLGTRTKQDVRLVLVALAGAAIVIAVFGLLEYVFKSNPLFDSIQIDVIGADARIGASDQFYRIRSLVGHPGYVAAILLGSMPLVLLVFWRRRWLLAGIMTLMAAAIFLTFSRGSWIIGTLAYIPIFIFRGRYWLRRNLKWIVPVTILPIAIITLDYLNREEVSVTFSPYATENGLQRVQGDGPVIYMSGVTTGVQAYRKFFIFNVDDNFYYGGEGGPVTIVIYYYDQGFGAVHIDYDCANGGDDTQDGIFTPSAFINKTDSNTWTTAAFYVTDARFENRQPEGADFRIVDDDSQMVLDEVTVQKGRLKLPGVVAQQWMSRGSSLSARYNIYPFAMDVLSGNPWGVGPFNTPGTDHHSLDSLPLTWMMEFGWPGLLLILGLLLLVAHECWCAWKERQATAVVLLLSIVVILLHGGHLMVLYDKPTLVLIAAVFAIYANIRPWRRGGAVIDVSNRDCMV